MEDNIANEFKHHTFKVFKRKSGQALVIGLLSPINTFYTPQYY